MTIDDQATNTDKKFGIDITSKAFNLLSNGIYSDKITAVIRELACNAVDSHVAAGRPSNPIMVTLPSINDPTFAVEDTGLGLSDDSVQNMYTSYFTSTKTNNLSMIGHLGLGSKSPFSFVREFFVESVFNGEYRKYRMYLDSTDTPRVQLMGSFESHTVNGVRVSFQVIGVDVDIFMAKAIAVFKWFAVTPVITRDGHQINIENNTLKLQASGWFTGKFGRFVDSNPIALMGNIAYPLDATSIKNITPQQFNLLKLNVVIKFELGDFEVAASRESIGYDTRSSQAICARLQIVVDELYQHIDRKIKSATTEWQAVLTFDSFFTNSEGSGYYLRNAMHARTFMWNGININSANKTVDMTKIYSVAETVNAIRRSDGIGTSLSRIKRNRFNQFTVEINTKHAIIFDDIPRNGAARIKQWMEKEGAAYTNFTVFDQPTGAATWDQLQDLLGRPPVILVSKMPAPPAKPKKPKLGKTTMMKYSLTSTRISPEWTNVEVDIDAGGYYTDYLDRKPIDSNRNPIYLVEIMHAAISLGYIPSSVPVYAGKGPIRARLKRLTNWINIVDLITKCVQADVKEFDKIADILATNTALEKIDMSVNATHRLPVYAWDLRDTSSKMREVIDLYRELQTVTVPNATRLKFVTALATELRIPRSQGTVDPRIGQMIRELKTRYPMLRLLNYSTWREQFTEINEYVNMVDTAWVFFELSRPTVEGGEEN